MNVLQVFVYIASATFVIILFFIKYLCDDIYHR